MPPPKVRCWFEIRSPHADPSDITRELGVAPSQVWRVGERPGGGMVRQVNGWRLAHPCRDCIDLDKMASELLDLLPSELPAAAISGGWEAQLTYVIEMQDETPASLFIPTTLARLARLGASMDIDMYVFTADDEEAETT